MFTPLTAASFAQHEQLDAMIAEAQAEGLTVDGLLTDNPQGGIARFVLVFDDAPQTGGDYDRTFEFDGTEIARGEKSLSLKVDQFVGQLAESLGEPDLVA